MKYRLHCLTEKEKDALLEQFPICCPLKSNQPLYCLVTEPDGLMAVANTISVLFSPNIYDSDPSMDAFLKKGAANMFFHSYAKNTNRELELKKNGFFIRSEEEFGSVGVENLHIASISMEYIPNMKDLLLQLHNIKNEKSNLDDKISKYAEFCDHIKSKANDFSYNYSAYNIYEKEEDYEH